MQKRLKLRELISKAQNGEEDALIEIIHRLIPLVKKYCRRLGYAEACSDLITWIVSAVHRYTPNAKWGRDELEQYFCAKKGGKK
jgi:DNA-directed RNA polymerase specialized sigma subunit